ncbi:MAG: hypothetical protein BGO39_05125 [Chloroflexi bacterium 54-19]|nr:MAG: hypothetical protein BGO39_05125 [Chloroflexi bacterium 54-19]
MTNPDFSNLKKGDTVLYYARNRTLVEYEVESVAAEKLPNQNHQEWLKERFEELPEGRELFFYLLRSKSEYADHDLGPGWGHRWMYQESATPEKLTKAYLEKDKKLKSFTCRGRGIDYHTTDFEETIYAESEQEALEVFESHIRDKCDDVLVDSEGGPWAEEILPENLESEDSED